MGSFWNPHPLPTIFPTMRPFNMQLLKQAGLLWTGRLRVRGGLAREMRRLMKDTSPPTHTPRTPLRTPITGFLMLPRIRQSSAHAKLFTHTFRQSPRPCQELALCLGPSPGCWVAARGRRLRVLRYLFICRSSVHIPGSDYPWGLGGGTHCCRLGL